MLSEESVIVLNHISYENRILTIVMIVSFVNPFTGSALTLALPDIGTAYGAMESQLSWVLEIYLISSTIFIMPLGKLADTWGKKKVFLLGSIIFMFSSLAVFAVSSMQGLFLLRFFQGIGSASIFATSLAIIALVYPAEKRGKAMGLTIAAVYSGLSLGPVIGGLLNYYYQWQSIFYFIAFFGAVAVLLTLLIMKEEWISNPEGHMDYWGAVLYAAALVLMMFGLSEILNLFYAPYVLAFGAVLFCLFLYREWHQSDPLLPVRIFTQNRIFSCSNFAAMLNYSATFAIGFLLSFYLQRILGLTSRDAGLIMLVQPVLMALLSPVTGSLSDRIQASVLASSGMGLIAVGLAVLAYDVPAESILVIIGCLFIIGIGFALFTAPNNNAIMSSVPQEYYGMASSVVGTVRLIGQVLSVAIVTLILSRIGSAAADPAEVLMNNIQFAFIVFTVLCLIGIFPSMVRIRK
jgi:EmrB/QacA subfamily drug resistance transporter